MTIPIKSNIHVTDNDPDIRLIKMMMDSDDLSSFANLNKNIYLIDSESPGWNMVTTLLDIETFDVYCNYLWDEAFKLVSKQKQNLEALMASYPNIEKTVFGQEVFVKDLLVKLAAPHSSKQHKQLQKFDPDPNRGQDQNQYKEAQIIFKEWLRSDCNEISNVNIDVLEAEASIFAEEWFKGARLAKNKRCLARLTDENATDEIQPFQLAVSYIYHRLKPIMEENTDKVTPNFLFTMVCVYWLIRLAQGEQKLYSSSNPINSASDLPKPKILSFDDYVFSETLSPTKGSTIRKDKNFYRDIAIKAWAYEQTKETPCPQSHLVAELEQWKRDTGMKYEGVRKYLRKLLKPGYLVDTLPTCIAQELGLKP